MAKPVKNIEKEQAVARHLMAAHAAGAPYCNLAGALALSGMEEAYRAQEAFIALRQEARGVPLAGYKIALTSPAMQAFLGVDHPVLGAIFGDTVLRDNAGAAPAAISGAAYGRVGVEFELALRLGVDVPPGTAHDAASVAAFVDAVIPAFELVDDRNAAYEDIDALSLVADNAWNAGVVLGAPVMEWRGLDLAATPVRLESGPASGKMTEMADTGAALGNPLSALAWAANELGAQGRPLSAGMIVMTGSTMKTRFPEAGENFRYEVEGAGAVRLSILP